MPAMAYAFDRGWLSVYQVLVHKNRTDGLVPQPWTRSCQYQPATPVRLTKGLDWGNL